MGWGIDKRIVAPVAALAVAASLSGCELAVTAVSFAATGVTYALTDKSPSDNMLSLLTDSDCQIFNFVKGQPICRDRPLPVQTASLAAIAPAAGDLVEPPPTPYRIQPGSSLVIDRLVARNVELVGFGVSEELFALVQDDGALEVFVHDPMKAGADLRLVLRIERYAADPDALLGVTFCGTFLRIKDIAV